MTEEVFHPVPGVDSIINSIEVLASRAPAQLAWLRGEDEHGEKVQAAAGVEELRLDLDDQGLILSVQVDAGFVSAGLAAPVRDLLDRLWRMYSTLLTDEALETAPEWQEVRSRASEILPAWRALRVDLQQRFGDPPPRKPGYRLIRVQR